MLCPLEVTTSLSPGKSRWDKVSVLETGVAGQWVLLVSCWAQRGPTHPSFLALNTKQCCVPYRAGGKPDWTPWEHISAKAWHIHPSGCELGNPGALSKCFSLYNQRFFSEKRGFLSACPTCLVSQQTHVGKLVPLGSHCNPITGAIPTEFKTILTGDFTDTSDLFLKASLCFQESFRCNACFQELPRQHQDYASLYWALGLSSEELGHGDFNALKCPLCLTERNRSINFFFFWTSKGKMLQLLQQQICNSRGPELINSGLDLDNSEAVSRHPSVGPHQTVPLALKLSRDLQ